MLVSLEPPVSFVFIDKPVIASLVSQVEPDFIEKTRVEREKQQRGGKLPVGVPSSSASAEMGSERDATHEFERPAATPERRTLDLIKYCLKTKRAALPTDRGLMIANIIFPKLKRLLVRQKAYLDDPIKPESEDVEQESNEVKSVSEEAEQQVDSTLSAPPDLVLLAIPLRRNRSVGGSREYVGTLDRKPNSLTVRVLVPVAVEIPTAKAGGTPSTPRIFGQVTERPSGKAPQLTVRAIAVF